LEFLLGAQSVGELFRRRQVLSNLHRLEEKHLAQLAYQSRQLDLLRDQIVARTNHLEGEYRLIDETRRDVLEAERRLRAEQEKLKQQQQLLAADLEMVHSDRALLERQRLEIQEALRRIEEMVKAARDTSTLAGILPGEPLTPLKGLLPWPVQGDVIEYFGAQKHRRSETVTDNPGIDIAASASQEVSCVADGRVAICTWLRGFGNVVIVEHPGDFFTVYAHLQQLTVQRGDEVRAGDGIGTASLDGITGKYRIHFELWEGKQKQNPLHWLTKR
ncbi:MAG: M23 family metallopeptidase, partial [bacterium]